MNLCLFFEGTGQGVAGQGNERDSAARSLRGRCAAEAAALTWIGGRQIARNADFSGYLGCSPIASMGNGFFDMSFVAFSENK